MTARTWLTSDTHYGHRNIIRYCNRPFDSLDEMRESLIERWNGTVEPGDTVYHLGDVSFLPKDQTRDIVSRLNGTKHLIKGNHDRSKTWMLDAGFASVQDRLVVDGVLLIHDPYETFGADGKPEYSGPIFCGHVHTDWRKLHNMVNVGVDQWRFKPILWGAALLMALQSA